MSTEFTDYNAVTALEESKELEAYSKISKRKSKHCLPREHSALSRKLI